MYLKGYSFHKFVQKHTKLPCTDYEIGLTKLILDVPPQRFEIQSFQDYRMEKAQPKQKLLENPGLLALLKKYFIVDGIRVVGLHKICLQSFRGLVHNFYSVLTFI